MKEVLTGAALPACQCEDGVGVGGGGGGRVSATYRIEPSPGTHLINQVAGRLDQTGQSEGAAAGGRDRRRPLGDCHAHQAGQEAGPHFHSTEKH